MDSWTRTELASALRNIMTRGQLESRFCFFIDGLDEYADEHAGDHHELIEYLDILAESTQVKLCVSSRPWTVFKDRYEGRDNLILVLQNLTAQDMYFYVEGMLQNDERFRRLTSREPQALELIPRIRDKAEGVFLWVYLVVRSLLRGLAAHDDTLELERRLSEIPTDLDEYFSKIFLNIEPVYRREAMRAFQLSTVSMPLSLIAFNYIPMEVLNPQYALESKVVDMSDEEVQASDKKAQDNVNKWCRDLLEFTPAFAPADRQRFPYADRPLHVRFLHRTVKDFLLRHEMQVHFAKHAICQSSPRQAMCMMFLAESKRLSIFHTENRQHDFVDRVDTTWNWARECEEVDCASPTKILDELGSVWQLVHDRLLPAGDPNRYQANTLQYAAYHQLNLYVSQNLDNNPKTHVGLLWYALRPDKFRKETKRSIAMSVLLLEKGVDPNQPTPLDTRLGKNKIKETAWQYFLAHVYDSYESPWRELARTWIRHGADLNTKIKVPHSALKQDVRTRLLASRVDSNGSSVEKIRLQTEVDEWLTEARARNAAGLFQKSSGSSSKASLRARFKSWLG